MSKQNSPCPECKIIIDCPALIVAANAYAEWVGNVGLERALSTSARGMAAYIDRFIAAYQRMEALGRTKDYEDEASEYSKEACDFAKKLDAIRAGTNAGPGVVASDFDDYKWKLIHFGQKLAGYDVTP